MSQLFAIFFTFNLIISLKRVKINTRVAQSGGKW